MQYSSLLFLSSFVLPSAIFTSIYYVLEYVLGVVATMVSTIMTALPCEVYDMARETDINQITPGYK